MTQSSLAQFAAEEAPAILANSMSSSQGPLIVTRDAVTQQEYRVYVTPAERTIDYCMTTANCLRDQ